MAHPPPRFEDGRLAIPLVFERALKKAEGVEILHLDRGAQPVATGGPQREVGIAAQVALLHVPDRGAHFHEDFAQPCKELGGFARRPEVRARDDLDEGHAAAVEIEPGPIAGISDPFVQRLAGVLLEVHAGDSNPPSAVPVTPGRLAVHANRAVVLRDLVALGQVGVEIALPRKDRYRRNPAAQGQCGAHRQFDHAAIQHRQGAGQAKADRAEPGVSGVTLAKARLRGDGRVGSDRTPAEDLGRGRQLRMDLEADDRLPLHGRYGNRAVSGPGLTVQG